MTTLSAVLGMGNGYFEIAAKSIGWSMLSPGQDDSIYQKLKKLLSSEISYLRKSNLNRCMYEEDN